MPDNVELDPATDWLRGELRQGRSQRAIAYDLGVSGSTVTRNIARMKRGDMFGAGFRSAVERRVAFERK